MATAALFARSVRLFARKNLSPEALSAHLATRAVQIRDDLIASHQAPNAYTTYVDGQKDAREAVVQPDGVILYRFHYLPQATLLAVEQAMRLSPVRSGRYRRAWCVVVDGRVWTQDLARIPAGSEVMVLNPEPYARKIDTGGMKTSLPPGIVEATRQIVQRQYPNIKAERKFVTIPAGVIPGAPWILRWNHGRSKSRSAGQPITYPALVLKEKV